MCVRYVFDEEFAHTMTCIWKLENDFWEMVLSFRCGPQVPDLDRQVYIATNASHPTPTGVTELLGAWGYTDLLP